jgi:hypothetical protein
MMIAIAACGLAGCIDAAQARQADYAASQQLVPRLAYFKDARTSLCFAASSLDTKYSVMTNVPCTEAVEHEIAAEQTASR